MIHSINDEIFRKIVDPINIKEAFFDLIAKFEDDTKTNRYKGVDGLSVSDTDSSSENIFPAVRQEMLNFNKISPAYRTFIPKKDGKKRNIHVYSIKERLKAEAIYRVLFPIFNNYFSDFLFSYRPSHPSYYAARSAVRRYKRYYGNNYVLVADISSYADTINHDILLQKLRSVEIELGIDQSTQKLLELFIKTQTIEDGVLINKHKGVLTGTPLYVLLSNFYMDAFDKWAGKSVAFYRRVGDDVIAMDKSAEKIELLQKRLLETTDSLKIDLNNKKGRLIRDTEEFKFLGYVFKNGKIGIDQSSVKKIVAKWNKQVLFASKSKNLSKKHKHIRSLVDSKEERLEMQFSQIIEQKRLVDDTEQIKKLSDTFFIILTSYFTGSYTHKNRRLANSEMKKTKIKSLFSHYLTLRHHKKKKYAKNKK